MNTTDKSFISRCAMILFIAALVLPPILSAFTPREEPSAFTAIICLLLATILSIISRTELPSRIVLSGMLAILLLFGFFVGFNFWKQAESRTAAAQKEAEIKAQRPQREAEAKAKFEALNPQKAAQLEKP